MVFTEQLLLLWRLKNEKNWWKESTPVVSLGKKRGKKSYLGQRLTSLFVSKGFSYYSTKPKDSSSIWWAETCWESATFFFCRLFDGILFHFFHITLLSFRSKTIVYVQETMQLIYNKTTNFVYLTFLFFCFSHTSKTSPVSNNSKKKYIELKRSNGNLLQLTLGLAIRKKNSGF
jgi:hypothetical protein